MQTLRETIREEAQARLIGHKVMLGNETSRLKHDRYHRFPVGDRVGALSKLKFKALARRDCKWVSASQSGAGKLGERLLNPGTESRPQGA